MSRLAVVDKELCKPKKCGHECAKVCPVNRKGENCVTISENAIIDESLCIGCGLCVKKCPFMAIDVVNLPEMLKEAPIHRFGQNGFALFRLPIPTKGVVGLLGPNGTGKSTALAILAGKIDPNLGMEKEQKNVWSNLIKLYRGSELQAYLERLEKGEIRVSIKPQDVSRLRHLPDLGKNVYDLQIDEKLIAEFDLVHLAERSLEQLSGGELQRVAIAAALSKDADIYYFDEPASYLDVRHRLKVAKAIRQVSQRAPVIVVEHDLAMLDWLADQIHIFYGKPGVFGVVSKPYGVRRGINLFLDGYIPEDNVRIRERIVFGERGLPVEGYQELLVSWTDIRKSYDGFKLTVESGEIRKNEVLSIFGANGLGKTTFARCLAGELEFEGNINRKIKISYKPQYIAAPKALVREVLSGVSQDLILRLGLDQLMEKECEGLSGGELQRVAIAICLSREAELYLLDEPSAFLDVDQRLTVASLLRAKASTASVVVIDHDMLFLSYVGDRAMLFSGKPGFRGNASMMKLEDGFNAFLSELGVTFRVDPENLRPRANKPNSVADREQKEAGKWWYQ
jgi:ATP-binding cassette subfamily E protein 1